MPANTSAAALPKEGFVRVNDIIGPGKPLPMGKTTWWEGVREGRYPQPEKLAPRITVWRVEDIRALIESPQQAGDLSRVEAKDDEAAEAEAQRREDGEDEEADTDAFEAA